MVFKRHLLRDLIQWKNAENRKPLILRGARQVGKTTLIKEFSKLFNFSILLNLERPKDYRFFEDYDDVNTILDAIMFENGISRTNLNETLIFIDEIQESPKAIQMLRFFYEDHPNLHIVAAGSLLEFALQKVKSFPVGRVQFLYLYPLNFEEFLEAIGSDKMKLQLNNIPVQEYAHKTLLQLFNVYAIIGGMPEIVKTYVDSQSISDLPQVYESIWATYKNDIEKYAKTETSRRVIKYIVDVAHLYIDQRIKFQNFGNSSYRSREVGDAFRILNDAKIIQLIYPTVDVEVPIKPSIRKSPKLQFLDIGIVNYSLNIQPTLLAMNDLSNAYKGALIPQVVTQEVLSLNTISSHKLHFWVREKAQSSSEVDLVVQFQDKVIPIEIKSGPNGKLKSLHEFIERSSHNYAIRIYAGLFSVEDHVTPKSKKPYRLMNLPYFLGARLPDYLNYFLTNY